MPVLTYDEGEVLAVIRSQCRYGDPVSTATIKDRVLRTGGAGAVDRSLRGLLSMGLITRPSRGNWLPAEAIATKPKEKNDGR